MVGDMVCNTVLVANHTGPAVAILLCSYRFDYWAGGKKKWKATKLLLMTDDSGKVMIDAWERLDPLWTPTGRKVSTQQHTNCLCIAVPFMCGPCCVWHNEMLLHERSLLRRCHAPLHDRSVKNGCHRLLRALATFW